MGQLLVFIVRTDKIVYFFIYLNYGKEAVKLKEYSFEIGSIDDRSETVAIVGVEYSSVSNDEKFYCKEAVDKLLIEKDKEIKRLEYLLYITSKVR